MATLDKLSLTNALYFSDVSVRSGAANFIHTYLDRFGSDPVAVNFLKDTSFKALEYLGNEYRNPASPLQNVSMPEQVKIAQEGFKLGWDGNRLNSYADTYYNQYPPEVQAILQKLPISDRMQLVDAGLEMRSQNSSGPWQYSLEKLIKGEVDDGPLPKNYIKNFASNQYNVIVTKEPVLLYRLGYHKSGLGRYLSFDPPISEINGRINSALELIWRNEYGDITASSPIDFGYAVLVPEDTTLYIGPAAGRDGMFIGNSIQIYVPDIYTVGEVLGQWNIPTWETNPNTLIPKIK